MKELSIEEKAQRYDEAKYIMEEYLKSGNAGVIAENTIKHAFPELKESEDEKIRKWIINEIKIKHHNLDEDNVDFVDKAISWLEKQGEQKPFDYENANIQSKDFAPKVEPKFKVGDWIVLTAGELSTTLQIVNVDTNKRLYWFNDSSYLPIVDEECLHLWTIQDAKDGDILAFDDDTIVIFKDLYNSTMFHSYCYFEYDIFDFSKDELPDGWESEGFEPATKKQRDILFQKMHEAGYEWNAERKKLKKVKQNPYGQRQECTDCQFNYAGECKGSCQMKREEQKPAVWSKDDEGIYQSIIDDTIQEVPLDDKQINWLKSLKERVQPQPKQEWSDIDKNMLFRTISDLEFLRDTISKDPKYVINIIDLEREISWLKSLRPQSTWKPSEEMLEALYRAVPENVMEISEDEMLLDKLYQGLKYGKVLSKK